MSTPHDPPEELRLRSRLEAACAVRPPAHLTARVEDLARPRVATVVASTARPPLGEILAPAAGIVLLLAFLAGSWPLVRAFLTRGGAGEGGIALPPVAGLSAFGPGLAALLVPLVLGWLFELSRGAPVLRRFLR